MAILRRTSLSSRLPYRRSRMQDCNESILPVIRLVCIHCMVMYAYFSSPVTSIIRLDFLLRQRISMSH
ncbi:unnamed protein product [Hymenolepis diminuta]|uniref:Uncharacterized protein n=1 Tax=Hymenolepis diminuta TaxID=6216 RepID=A0A564Y1V9_HYMDI|nr:unnamed protein product [Hymenolepis diminuta]